MDDLFGLNGKVALLTGGAGVLAGAIGKGLANVGVKVVLADLYADRAKEAAETICSAEGEAYGIGMNVLEKESLEKARDKILDKFGSMQ